MDESEPMTLEVFAITGGDTSQHAYRVSLAGEIDAASAPKLDAALDELIEGGAAIVVLDASSIEFIDSIGPSIDRRSPATSSASVAAAC